MADAGWDVGVPSSLERLLLCCLEDHCADERWVRFKFADLQALTGMSQNRIKQAANTLWAMGRLEWEQSRGGKPQRWHVMLAKIVPVPAPPAAPPFPNVAFTYVNTEHAPTTYTPSPGKDRPHREAASELVKEWFATTDPRPTPAGGFPAAVKIVETILSAGWEADSVRSALLTVPTLSLASMEFSLRRQVPPRSSGRPSNTTNPAVPTEACPRCGSYANLRTQAGRRCASCDEPLDV